MEKEQRSRLQKATQEARRLLEEEFSRQLLETYDINVAAGRWSEEPGAHLQAEQRLLREKLLAWIEHRSAQINDEKEALLLALREMAFTALNRFVALKLMEARELVRPCVSGGLESEGFQEFTAVAQGLLVEQESSYRLYLETIFEDVSRELRALFDPRDPASLLWPKRTALLDLLDILNRPELAELWREDETLGWIYQYFNGDAERKKMREESSVPRNSRELAVRNQFFTPRYVVEFLTDNTLGRIWYEMRQGDTDVKERCRYLVRRPNEIWLQPGEEAPAEVVADEALSQEELLKQPVYIPHRPLKDPREIRMLDPACGSMHFGLYAFDLYLAIYEDAWEIAQGSDEQAKQGEAFAAFVTYAAYFASKAAFLREVPRLILQHNIHGIDIDPRATQIARLTLWLRAQRAWQEQGVAVAARPAITRSNVVCAEPMPGERELLADFVDQQFPEAERGLVQQLLETIFDKMQLAGEAGSLLKIEEEIRDAIDQARREWQKLAIQQRDLFSAAELAALGGVGSSLNADLQNLTKDFWINIEERIYLALRDYAEAAENSGSFQRRLFADDAAQGFAFIDACRKRYDVVEMNPPFGEVALNARNYMGDSYVESKSDIGMAFASCFTARLEHHGCLGAITNRVFIANETLDTWRDDYLLGAKSGLYCLLDLGFGVLDGAKVEAAAFVIDLGITKRSQSTFIRVLDSRDKESATTELLVGGRHVRGGFVFHHQLDSFHSLPGHVLAYQLPLSLARRIASGVSLASMGGKAAVGLQPSDDFRFLRLAWEIPSGAVGKSASWAYYAKGGEYQPYWADIHLLVNWANSGAEIRNFFDDKGKVRSRPQNVQHYFKPGVTWPQRTTSDFSARVLPDGCIFSVIGQAIFCGTRNRDLAYIAGSYSRAFKLIVDAVYGSGDASSPGSMANQYRCGVIALLPPPIWLSADEIVKHALRLVSQGMSLFDNDETSRYFSSLASASKLISQHVDADIVETSGRISQMLDEHAMVDSKVLDELGFDAIDRNTVDSLVGPHPTSYVKDVSAEDIARLEELWEYSESNLIKEATAKHGARRQLTMKSYAANRRYELVAHALEVDARSIARVVAERLFREPGLEVEVASRIISWLVGVTFGRWDIRYATGEKAALELPDPFAPLPVCPPGQLQNRKGLPARLEDVPSAYPVRIPWGGILVDDPNHLLDLERHIREVIEVIWCGKEGGPTAEAIEQEACDMLAVKTLRDYFRKPASFFAYHLSRYSKSRRQAPIYWQLSAGNGSYSAWLYYHRFTSDTLYRLLRDFVEPRIQEAEGEQFEFESQGGLSGDAASLLHEVQALLQDLRLFKSELELVAPLWNPNLNDGVIINHAILWRITPYTPWQRKCKECWDKLVKGDYDWAHLAFHLWPERVIRKCQSDRSLAIAHGLEERLWQETSKGNWLQRQLPEAELQALLAEHSKPAVQNALERFLAASPPVAAARTRPPRAAKSASTGTSRRPRGSAPEVDAETSRQTLLVLTAAPAEGLGRNAIAELLAVEAASLTAVIKQLKEGGQIEQLGAARGAKYRLTESGLTAVESQAGEDD
ncbi:BREX-1 system adenine-specific DNA-methyltransferase PglX [Cyanobium sp. ATX 6E8]|uniref:BREX-1 system adenine-specific DNA-methyltransferase PglX n=1 Tax=Cyanobium sp. ATX 6E8 TaxID=2823701 RepID=UPI0020CEB09C|nr:BREX-1 system adenine-specific DNA-methyltransferase PglX [Cyanobium sp. ATX 6E8]MCP9943335.1 BREX-1 system adenine-specific DNA-methyltransferase PglX [Cyanobium sp. ATX 6E8]